MDLIASFEIGSGLSVTAIALLISVSLGVLATAWAGWTAVGMFQLWATGQATLLQLGASVTRAALVVLILFWIFGN